MQDDFMKEEELDLSIFCTEQDYKAVVHHGNSHKESHQGTTLLYQTRQPYHYYYQPRRQFIKKIRYREKTPEGYLKQREIDNRIRVQYMEKPLSTTISLQLIANSPQKIEKTPEEERRGGGEGKEPAKQPQIQPENNAQSAHQEEQIICLAVRKETPEGQSPLSKDQKKRESESQGQGASPKALDPIDFEEIPIIQLSSEQEMPRQRRKAQKQKKQLIAFNTNQQSSLSELSNLSRRRNLFSFSLQPFDLAKQLQGEQEDLLQQFRNVQFRTLTVKFVFRGPIQVIKIKSMMVSLFSSDEIKIEKNRDNEYNCEEIYRGIVDIIDNVYHNERRRDYENSQKEAKLQLCRIRLPNYSFKKHYHTQKVRFSPVTINKISVVCYCSRKSQFVLSSLGGTCKNCSLPFELSIRDISIA